MHEFELIKKYFSKLSIENKYSLNLNDDVFFDSKKKLAITIDTYIEGVHFIDFKKPELVIKKIIRSSISDLICKGVLPKYYFISGSGNKKYFSVKNLKRLSKALKQEQSKFGISLCGGDTVKSDRLSFTITSIGFSKKIIKRNNAFNNDDIYVTGNLGDSFIGLKILQNKISTSRNFKDYFVKNYFHPNLNLELAKRLFKFANTSIDVSDGLIADLEKLINRQNLSYIIYLNKIPISKRLKKLIKIKNFKKETIISQGDDYQILFTASKSKSRIIDKTAKVMGIKISKIGEIRPNNKKSVIINKKGEKIEVKHKGYYHKF